MSKKIKRSIIISIIIVFIVLAIISSFYIVKYFSDRNKINNIYETYSNENIQDRIETQNVTTDDDLMLEIDGEKVVGIIKIDKIGYEGPIYEVTTLATLSKGVGHLSNSPYFNGNVCLAAHNTSKFWAKLNTLENGDMITYTSFLGTKDYVVSNIKIIDETDCSDTENTEDNRMTLITCVKGQKEKRLCVQALEKK